MRGNSEGRAGVFKFCFLVPAIAWFLGCATPEIHRRVIVFDGAGRPIQGARVYMARKKFAARGMTLSDGSTKVRTFTKEVSLVVEREGYEPFQINSTTNLVIKVVLDQTKGNAQ